MVMDDDTVEDNAMTMMRTTIDKDEDNR